MQVHCLVQWSHLSSLDYHKNPSWNYAGEKGVCGYTNIGVVHQIWPRDPKVKVKFPK